MKLVCIGVAKRFYWHHFSDFFYQIWGRGKGVGDKKGGGVVIDSDESLVVCMVQNILDVLILMCYPEKSFFLGKSQRGN